jgi:ribosome-binding ATPase YchF (GTP1/OBG family)
MHSFLTTGDKESRAWPIMQNATAVEAAGVIHTDLAHGFIRAEVVHYDDFVREGGYAGCRAKGLVRLEGKEYVVKDGDILVIRHSG